MKDHIWETEQNNYLSEHSFFGHLRPELQMCVLMIYLPFSHSSGVDVKLLLSSAAQILLSSRY